MPRVCFKQSLSEGMMCAMSAVMFCFRLHLKICSYKCKWTITFTVIVLAFYFICILIFLWCVVGLSLLFIYKINSIFFQFHLCDIVWCVTFLFVWSCICSLMCCLRISNRYSRMWFSCVQNEYISFFQMRDACGRWRNDLGGQSQGDVASPLIRYMKCLHISVEVLLGLGSVRTRHQTMRYWVFIVVVYYPPKTVDVNQVEFVTMSTKYDDSVEKWRRQTDKHVRTTSSRIFSHIIHTS